MSSSEDVPALGSEARALLADASAFDGPPPGSKERVRVALTAALAAGVVTATAGATAGTGAGTATGSAASVGATGTGATIGGFAGVSLATKVAALVVTLGTIGGVVVASTGAPPSSPPPAPARMATVVEHELVVPEPTAIEVAPPVVAEPVVEAAPEMAIAEPRPIRLREVAPLAVAPTELAPAVEPAPLPASTLAEENRLLRAGRSARTAGDAETALARANEHASRFPAGLLAEDRDRLRIDSLCDLGRAADAERARASFRHDYPGAILPGPCE